MTEKMVYLIRNRIVEKYKERTEEELTYAFCDDEKHAIAIPWKEHGVIHDGIYAGLLGFLYDNPHHKCKWGEECYNLEKIIYPEISHMYDYDANEELYLNEYYFVITPDMIKREGRLIMINKITSTITQSFFHVMVRVSVHQPAKRVFIRRHRRTAANQLHFIFLYDKETEKAAKALARCMEDAYTCNYGGIILGDDKEKGKEND